MSNEPSSNNTIVGRAGEKLASDHLLQKGYEILCTNYRSGKAEIDLIVQKEGLLVFVEVKYRRSTAFGYPEDFVHKHKQKMILMGADHYIIEKNWLGDIRFDIVSIVDSNGKALIEHFEDCF